MKAKFYFSSIVLVIAMLAAIYLNKASARTLYGITISEEVLEKKAIAITRHELSSHPLLSQKATYINAVEKPHVFNDRTLDFFLISAIILLLGIFKTANPTYFRNIFKAFRNPTLSTRQLKDQLRQNAATGLLLDTLFCVSAGLYIYFSLTHFLNKPLLPQYAPILVILGIILLLGLVYVLRYLFLKFTGWVFGIDEITDNYTFNIYLINKILGIAIIPFTIIMAFGEGAWVQASLLLSLILILILFANRYLRSGVVFGYFLKYSKFHFFMYLCASEILPFAVLLKLANQLIIS